MIELDDSLEALWFIDFEKQPVDLMAALKRATDERGERFEFIYRFRYYVDADCTSNSKDKKSWRHSVIQQTSLQSALKTIALVLEAIAGKRGGKLYSCLRNGRTTDDLMAEWKTMPFVHVQVITGAEVEAFKKDLH